MTDLAFYQNILGKTINQKELSIISSPKLEVQMHATLRFCGIGCIIGTMFGIYLYIHAFIYYMMTDIHINTYFFRSNKRFICCKKISISYI